MARILVVEDEDELRCLLVEVLAEAGHAVVQAENGDVAASLLPDRARFDALLTDLKMPGILNGLTLGEKFRQFYPDGTILYITGTPDALSALRARPGKEAVISKPCGLAKLVSIVHAMLARKDGMYA